MMNLRNYSCALALCVSTSVLAENTLSTDAAHEEETDKQVPMEDVQRFSNALSDIKHYYVNSIDDKVLFDNAIRGMLSGLDPHSSYLDEDEFKELQTETTGEFGGLGIEITPEDGAIKVITPLVDSPAFKAGIKSGDYIITINSQSVQGMSLQDAVKMMRGKVGSPVKMTILRKNVNKPLHFTVLREKVIIQSVKSKLLDNQYGYIRLSQFQTLTAQDTKKAVDDLKKQSHGHLAGLILDLRNNPGGLLESAIQVSDAFLEKPKNGQEELIVYTKGRVPNSKFTAVANPDDILNKAPMIVLINNGSASASEIVAGALKDNKRAIIVGTKSFGKGSVQTVLPLDDKRAIKLTTALYYTPSGVSIQAQGITPDIVVEEMMLPDAPKKPNLFDFSEASLKGHIENKTNPKRLVSQDTQKDDEALMHNDYQLYTALTILKGISVSQN